MKIVVGLVLSSSLADCLAEVVSQPYTGTVALTNHGFTCSAWTDHKGNDALFPGEGSAAKARNYCRNFNGKGRPLCVTYHQYIDWDYCDLQICGGK